MPWRCWASLCADYGTIDVLINLGRLKVETGRSTAAATHWAEALAVSQRLSDPGTANILSLLATLPATSSKRSRCAAPLDRRISSTK